MDMLVAIVGPGNAKVNVSAVLNFDRAESKIKRFLPAGGDAQNPTGIPVSIQQNIEAYSGTNKNGSGDKPAGGKPGTASNIPSYNGAG